MKGDAAELLRRLLAPLFEQGTRPVHAAICCGRLYVGEDAPVGCRRCGKPPVSVAFDRLEDADIARVPSNTILS